MYFHAKQEFLLDWAGKGCRKQTLQLITKIRELQTKKFYKFRPKGTMF